MKIKKWKTLNKTVVLILAASLLLASAVSISITNAMSKTSLSYNFYGWDQVSNSWTKGNIAGYAEGDIVNYVLVVSGSPGTALPPIIEIEWDFFQAPKTSIPQGAVLADYLQNFYVGYTFNYRTAPRHVSTQDGFTPFTPSSFDPDTYPDTAESPSPQRNFKITAGINDAPTEIGNSGEVVYYFEAHLSQSCIWLNNLETLFEPIQDQISWVISGEDLPSRIGSSGFSGASPHFYLDVPGVGNKAIPIPIPPAPPGVIMGHKWNDVVVNGEYDNGIDLPIENWKITCSGVANGVPVNIDATTDSSGSYMFLLLPLGTWTITEANDMEGWHSSSVASIEIVLPLPSESPYGAMDAFGAKNVDFFNYQPSSTTSTLLSATTITLGESVYDTAAVTTNAGTPTGTVQFYVQVPGGSFEPFGDPVSLDASGNAQSIDYTPMTTGLYYFKAVYAGDGNYYIGSESGDTEEPLTVGSAGSTTTTLLSDDSITIASLSDDSITLGGTVYDTVHVEGLEGYPVPTGTVQFYVQVPGGSFEPFGDPVSLDASGNAQSIDYTPMTAGLYYFKAIYFGDSNYDGSESGPTEEPLTVGPATPVVTTILSSDSIALGESVSDMVAVTGLGDNFPVPSGTVDFQVMAPGESTWTTFSSKTLIDGSATSDLTTPTISGLYFFRAVFTSDDDNYVDSQSGPTEEPLTVGSAGSTTTTLLSDDSITLGGTVYDTVHVEGLEGYPVPTGTVQFYVQVPGGSFEPFGDPVSLDASGNAQSIDYTPMTAGLYYFKAIYFGDSNYDGSESGDTEERLLVDEIGLTVSTTYQSSRKSVVFSITVFNQEFAPSLTGVTVAATGDYIDPEVIGPITLEADESYTGTVTQSFALDTHGAFTVTFTASGQDSNGFLVSVDITVSVAY